MADCLQKRIPVSQPTYCIDAGTGDVIDGTVMYNWMHVRAIGPNCLKDTSLSGTTRVLGPIDVCDPPIEMLNPQPFLQDLVNPDKQLLNINPPDCICINNGQNQSNSPGIDLVMPTSALNISEMAGSSSSGVPNADWLLAAEFIFDVDTSILDPLPFGNVIPAPPATGTAYSISWSVDPMINRYYQSANAAQIEVDAVYVDVGNMIASGTPGQGLPTDYSAAGECYAVSVQSSTAFFDSASGLLTMNVLLYDPSDVVSTGNVNFIRLSCAYHIIMNVDCSIQPPPPP